MKPQIRKSDYCILFRIVSDYVPFCDPVVTGFMCVTETIQIIGIYVTFPSHLCVYRIIPPLVQHVGISI